MFKSMPIALLILMLARALAPLAMRNENQATSIVRKQKAEKVRHRFSFLPERMETVPSEKRNNALISGVMA